MGTMNLVYGQDERLIPWLQARLAITLRPDATAIGLERAGELKAVVAFDGFSPCDCNLHVASDGSGHWLTRRFLVAVFAYPFIQLGLRRVTALVAARNTRALRFDLHLGFDYEGCCRDALPDDDLLVLGMTRAQCRFLTYTDAGER